MKNIACAAVGIAAIAAAYFSESRDASFGFGIIAFFAIMGAAG